MIVYRVDRHSELFPGKIINLVQNVKLANVFDFYNNSFSQHGINFLNDYSDSSVWELCLEFIRLTYFPNFPSRLQSIFGTKTLEDALSWKNYFCKQFDVNINILKIECEKFYEFDASWITFPPTIPNNDFQFNIPSIAKMLELSYKYWAQEKSPKPFPEILISLPAKVIDFI